MLLAHLADTHLGYAQYGLEEREEDFMEVFREAVERALEDHVEVIVHSGDVFHDPRPRIKTLKQFRDVVKALAERGVPLVTVPGSHDMQRRRGMPPVALFDDLGVRVLTTKAPVWEYRGVMFAGFQYLPRHRRGLMLELLGSLGGRAAGHGGKSVLVLHQGLKQLIPVSFELSLSELPKAFHYYAMGHIHKPYAVPYGKGVLAYPGSTEVVSVSEIPHIGDKGFYMVDLSGDSPEVSRVKLERVRPQYLYEVKPGKVSSILPRALSDAVRAGARKPVVHIRVLGEPERRDVESLRVKLEPLCLKVRVEVRPEGEEEGEEQELQETIDLRKALENYLTQTLGKRGATLASLAYELLSVLSAEGYSTDEAVRRAIREVEEAYEGVLVEGREAGT